MKKTAILFTILLITICTFAQESVSPSLGTNIQRRVSVMRIEGKLINNVLVEFKSNTPDYVFVDKGNVKVTVTKEGKEVYKKKFKDSYLYIFGNGQIQVGKPNFTKVLIAPFEDKYWGEINEKEGVY